MCLLQTEPKIGKTKEKKEKKKKILSTGSKNIHGHSTSDCANQTYDYRPMPKGQFHPASLQ